MNSFIELKDLDSSVENLFICIDSIERFHWDKELNYKEIECTHVHFKGHSEYHRVFETPNEIKALIVIAMGGENPFPVIASKEEEELELEEAA